MIKCALCFLKPEQGVGGTKLGPISRREFFHCEKSSKCNFNTNYSDVCANRDASPRVLSEHVPPRRVAAAGGGKS